MSQILKKSIKLPFLQGHRWGFKRIIKYSQQSQSHKTDNSISGNAESFGNHVKLIWNSDTEVTNNYIELESCAYFPGSVEVERAGFWISGGSIPAGSRQGCEPVKTKEWKMDADNLHQPESDVRKSNARCLIVNIFKAWCNLANDF